MRRPGLRGQGNQPGAVSLVAHVAAVLSISAGVVHISAAGDHTSLPVMLWGFVIVAGLQVALGMLLLWRRPSRALIGAGVALMAGAIGVWALSRTAGLPFLEDGHTEPIGAKDGITVLFEVASIPALLMLLSPDLGGTSVPPRLGDQARGVLTIGCFALLVPALLLGGGEHHSHEEAVALGLHDEAGHGDSEGHELAHRGAGPSHEAADHGRRGGKGASHDHSRSSAKTSGHGAHTLASAPLGSPHQHVGGGGSDRDAHSNHGGDDTDHRKHRGRKHGNHRKRDKGPGEHHGGGHGGGHGEGGGGGGSEPPVTVTYEPVAVCLSGVCVP